MSRKLKPLRKGDPAASIPLEVDGVRVFPPTIDENGNITYYQEFPAEWKPYSWNYRGHGWLISTQICLWLAVYVFNEDSKNRKEKFD